MQRLDEYVRVRLRMGLWKEWKNCKTRVANLLKLKASRQSRMSGEIAAEVIAE